MRFKKLFFSFMSLLVAMACENRKDWHYHDPKLEYQKHHYDQLTQKNPVLKSLGQKKLKKPEPYKKPLPALPKDCQKIVSLTLSQPIPLREIFMSLAQQAEINVIIDPSIQGGTTLHAQKQKFIDILSALCENHGLRYRFKNNILHIEQDRPYAENYNLHFLILARSNQNRLSIATDIFTPTEAKPGHKDDNGSNTLLTADTKTDFWQELTDNLKILLNEFCAPNDRGDIPPPAKFTIHKQAGLISVFGSQAQHHQVQKYLEEIRRNIERQVLIEAKIVEVNLNDEFKSGINWNLLRSNFLLQAPLGHIASSGPIDTAIAPAKNVFSLGVNARKLTGVLSFLNHFGTVRTLSNPRLTVINNHTAILKVAKQKVYFKLNYTRDYNYLRKSEQNYYSSDVKTVPIGLMMCVHPTIREDGKIIMTLRPTISQVIQEIEDPSVAIASGYKMKSVVPEVQIRELDSILSMNSGEAVVVGGLMEERSDNDQSGLPELEDAPLLGGLFKGKSNDRQVTELVIFIRATIIDGDGFEAISEDSSISPADRNMYENFTQDPRPLTF